ncbi:MAG TPA: DUF72 domain-containing protein [Dehalococcoidia bacterium]|nr:DUF72 domain-containing protein [Dehalococcoidia bacterium]
MSENGRHDTLGRIRIGTASWTDKSLIECGRFYPPEAKTAEARLQFYASQFPIVEVDSSYYAMPAEHTAGLWVERTPDGFVFDIKAYALFTQHPTPPRSLPKDLREALPDELGAKRNLYYRDLPASLQDELWRRFAAALLPLDSAGKLGVVLFQFPKWFLPGRESRAYLAALRERLPQYTPAVEFRNPLWLDAEHTPGTLALLREHGYPFVCVDEPQGTPASVPPIVAATAETAVVRFHGRNAATWAARDVGVSAKYDYQYTDAELQGWLPGIEQLAEQSSDVHVLMNNCVEDKGIRNAQDLARLLREAPDVAPAVAPPRGEGQPAPQPRLL